MAGNATSSVITIKSREAQLKRRIRRHLAVLGFRRGPNGSLTSPGASKDVIRTLHRPQRAEILHSNAEFISGRAKQLQHFFASGADIDPERINLRIELVSGGTWQADLFRLASLTWSVPVSKGFGRRLRYIVWDDYNGKIAGIFAVGDPVFNLSVRDNFIGWSGSGRAQRLVNVMDAYVLGAVPPYNFLLGGKIVACLVRTREVYEDFYRKYGESKGIISKECKSANLLAVTTSSSMGRSSVYNRLKLGDVQYFKSLGYSGGWGHFHIPSGLFEDLRGYLRSINHPYADTHGYGDGPNWRIRAIRAAMDSLGFKGDMLRHGVQREVFISLFAENSLKVLKSGDGIPYLKTLSTVSEVGCAAVNRWAIPRAISRPDYRNWNEEMIISLINNPYFVREVGAKHGVA